MPSPARLIPLLLAVAVGASYGAPCLPGAGDPPASHSGSEPHHGGHSHGSANAATAAPDHSHPAAHEAASHGAPGAGCEASLFAPCPCGCGEGSGPAGLSARPGPAVRIAVTALPAAEAMSPVLAPAPRPSPAHERGIDHVPI